MQKVRDSYIPDLFPHSRMLYSKNTPLVVGDFFEEASRNLAKNQLGMEFRRYSNDPTSELCPDLKTDDQKYFLESKASNAKGRIKIRKVQMDYYNSHDFPSVSNPNPEFFNISFFFWFYDVEKFPKKFYVEDLREIIARSVMKVYSMDIHQVNNLLSVKTGISLKDIESSLGCTMSVPVDNFNVYGHKLKDFTFNYGM